MQQRNPLYKKKLPKPEFTCWKIRWTLWTLTLFRPSAKVWDVHGAEYNKFVKYIEKYKSDPFDEVKIALNIKKSTDCGQNLSSSEGGQDLPARQIFSYPSNVVARHWMETSQDG